MRQIATLKRLGCWVLATIITAFSATVAIGTATGAEVTPKSSFSFNLVRSTGITTCLAHATGKAVITITPPNDTMKVSISGVPADSGFALFLTQLPSKPFGVATYESKIHADSAGAGSATVRGEFNVGTFALSEGGPTTAFAPTHLYHLGLWFTDPTVPFRIGCEPGATSPIVTPFDSTQHAGIQALSTANFPDFVGPLSHVKS